MTTNEDREKLVKVLLNIDLDRTSGEIADAILQAGYRLQGAGLTMPEHCSELEDAIIALREGADDRFSQEDQRWMDIVVAAALRAGRSEVDFELEKHELELIERLRRASDNPYCVGDESVADVSRRMEEWRTLTQQRNINVLLLVIDRFQMRVAAMRAGRSEGWVKCSERMPEQGHNVIAITELGGVQIATYLHPGHGTQDGEWRESYSFGHFSATITHWLPLPAPPSMREAENGGKG